MPSSKLLVTEIFFSLQGEGHFVGVPSVFIRLHGCNFECPGFGQSRDKSQWVPSSEMLHNQKDLITSSNRVTDLPVPSIGCDSSLSWAKSSKHLATEYTPIELAFKVLELIKQKMHTIPTGKEDIHLVITGGEPLIPKWQKLLPYFFIKYSEICSDIGMPFKNVTFETNGTYGLKEELVSTFNSVKTLHGVLVTFSVSPKLSISGESIEKSLSVPAVSSYNRIFDSFIYTKFVVRDRECLDEVKHFMWEYLRQAVPIEETYLMPEGGTVEGLALTETEVAEICMETGYRFSPRLHMNLWRNAWGT